MSPPEATFTWVVTQRMLKPGIFIISVAQARNAGLPSTAGWPWGITTASSAQKEITFSTSLAAMASIHGLSVARIALRSASGSSFEQPSTASIAQPATIDWSLGMFPSPPAAFLPRHGGGDKKTRTRREAVHGVR